MKAMIHATTNRPTDGLPPRSLWTACGTITSPETLTSDDSEHVTCRRCRTRIAGSLPMVSAYSPTSLWNELRTKELDRAILGSAQVTRAKQNLLGHINEVLRLLDSAKDDVNRERRSVEGFSARGFSSGLDHAMNAAKVVGFLAMNIRIDLLAKYGAEFDAEVERVIRPIIDG